MDKFRQIVKPSSKAAVIEAAKYLLLHSELLDSVLQLSVSAEKVYSWHSAWTLKYIAEKKPDFLTDTSRFIIEKLPKVPFESSLASLLKVLVEIKFDLEINSHLLDFCLDLLKSDKRSFIKYYGLDILVKFANFYPEISEELYLSIDLAFPVFETYSLRKKAKKIMMSLQSAKK